MTERISDGIFKEGDMITEDRIKHCLSVARKCHVLAKNRYHDEDVARKAFVVGLLHDIGYNFVA